MFVDKNIDKLDWKKTDYMMPVIAQNYLSGEILMHGYMNKKALLYTIKKKLLTFFSRTKKRLWTKGELSKNFLHVISISLDCDHDTILVLVKSIGNTCHLNRISCFNYSFFSYLFLYKLDNIIEYKKHDTLENSYTKKLYSSGTARIAQKVGEEAIETVLAALEKDSINLINEASDLIFHLLVLLHNRNLCFNDIIKNLKNRMKN
ncbi:phosphoribosyl-AMP cyclohydrolase / phosphoribosyl-ATP pyrophosphohydrolase [Buchnera aphidicola (Cinara tujafilina)]|uniref:Histidine biosynthesis bifunctional protein HisIE n=1 Tax=Buchnera aphidicola (Cinara tujafilina) TaxID=261317 RepID=F7WZ13_9GAMM|nr:bifunctional phosphoribosyl-AMP cyclohydrolase/phosphoribosyl-ATP diphosphatase HisIE [Buchnera aphidicola]AEH39663.1 phosphoribosyl-AMP cyclohydrolase / phosphoribosyl-ATP pyrophosphohydrolase [Buchnera aphidicola (Cinara tujafilina)]